MRLLLIAAIVTALTTGFVKKVKAFTCDDVNFYRPAIKAMSKEERKAWVKRLRLTKKDIREARKCRSAA